MSSSAPLNRGSKKGFHPGFGARRTAGGGTAARVDGVFPPIVLGPVVETATEDQRVMGRRRTDVGSAPWADAAGPRTGAEKAGVAGVAGVAGATGAGGAEVSAAAAATAAPATATASSGPLPTPHRVEGISPAPEELLKRAREESRRIAEEARSTGFEQGRREGWEVGRAEAESLVVQARRLVEQAKSEKNDLLREAEPELLRFAMAVARKVIRQELAREPHAVVDTVAEALGRVRGDEEVKVRVNPADAVLIDQNRDRLASASRRARRWTLIEDDSVEAGGCVVETANGNIDARVDRQVARIERALEEAMDRERH